jgi:hypothetical protein
MTKEKGRACYGLGFGDVRKRTLGSTGRFSTFEIYVPTRS